MTAIESTPAAVPVLRRRVRPWEERPVGFFPAFTTREDGCAYVLEQCRKHGFRQAYLQGGWDAASTPARAWFEAATAEGWDVRYTPRPRSAHCVRDGVAVDLRMTGSWFGQSSLLDAGNAYDWLKRLVRDRFDSRAILFGTPARTGQDLLERSLPLDARGVPYEYPAIPADVADILRHNVGQGRKEFPQLPDTPRESDQLYALDARWMYASCIRNLPVGPVTHDDEPDFVPYRNGWYRIAFRVPLGWRHIGLLPVWDGEAGKTVWPNTAIREWETWASEPEIRLAREQGWKVHVLERILFAPTSQTGADPARAWIEKLIHMRAGVDLPAPRTSHGIPDEVVPLLSRAIRRLCIDTVGSWWRPSRRQFHITPHAQKDTIPPGAIDPTPIYTWDKRGRMSSEPLRWEWSSEERLTSMQLAYARPEWAAMVWGRSRAKLNAFALTIPPSQLGPLRSDAVIVTSLEGITLPRDTGKPGCFRLKREWHWDTPRELPRDERAWLALLAESGEREEEREEEEGDTDGE